MNYDRIKELAEKKYSQVSEFIAEAGIANATYYKMLEVKNTNVVTLEKISRALDVSPAYWWQDEEVSMVSEPKVHYGYVSKKVFDDLLEKWNEDRESKRKLEKHIEFLQSQIEGDKRKNAHCG
jgi:DNA-binding Xre family transcriptional regulator